MSSFITTKNISSSERLAKTKACNNILKYGKCEREVCTFAHSLEEHRDPCCTYDDMCNKRDICRYMHSNETQEEYYSRCNITLPEFPDTQFIANQKNTDLSSLIIDLSLMDEDEDDILPKFIQKIVPNLQTFLTRPRVRLVVPKILEEDARFLAVTQGNIDVEIFDN